MIRSFAPLALVAVLFASAHAAPSEKLLELRNQRNELNREIRKAVPDPNKLDPELEKLQRASIDASRAYQKAIDEHPKLKVFKSEGDVATTKLTNAITKNDSAAREAAQKEISDVMNRRMDAASKEPDLQPLAKAAQESGDAYNNRLKEFLGNHPATKENAAKLAEVQAAIMEEMKNQRENP